MLKYVKNIIIVVKIVINPKYEHLRSWIAMLPQSFYRQGEVIYRGRNELRLIDGYTVKRYRRPILINRIAYLFRAGKAKRAFDNAIYLNALHIPTPEPIAYVICKKGGLIDDSYLITQHCTLNRKLYEFGEQPIKGKEHILLAFARFTATLHDKGIYHKDYSPGNILFAEQNNQVQFCLVDINRMTFGNINMKKGCANFARLWGNTYAMRLIAHEYAALRGFPPDECEREVLHYWHRFWQHKAKTYPNYD